MQGPAGETFSLAAGLIKCSLFTIVRDESGILNCAAIASGEARGMFLRLGKRGRRTLQRRRQRRDIMLRRGILCGCGG
jgi:hypothetical protein